MNTVYYMNQLINASLFGLPFKPDTGVDWTDLYHQMGNHAVKALPTRCIVLQEIPDKKLYKRWIDYGISNQVEFYHLLEIQTEITGILEEHKIPHAILKGTSAGKYYPYPELRSYGDIDILIDPAGFEQSVKLLVKNGFHRKSDNGRHVNLEKDCIAVELHRYFSLSEEYNAGKKLDQLLYNALLRTEKAEIAGMQFHYLPEMENGLVLLYHIRQHLLVGLGYRQIIDWMMYVKTILDDHEWNQHFESMAKELGLKTLAVTLTRMCQMFFGLSDEISWCKKADEKLCIQLLEYIYNQGNFGAKATNSSDKTVGVLVSHNIFSRLQVQGLKNWKYAGDHRWVRPFAWLYQLVRYVRLGFKREKPWYSLYKDYQDTRKRKSMCKRLGI